MRINNIKIQNQLDNTKTAKEQNKQKTINNFPSWLNKIFDSIENMDFFSLADKLNTTSAINPEFKQIDLNSFKYKDYYFKLTTEQDSEYHKNIFENLKAHDIDIAPEYIDAKNTNEGFSILIYKIPGTENQEVISYTQIASLVPQASKIKAYEAVVNMLNIELANYEIMNKLNFYVTPDKQHKIVVLNWDDLYKIPLQNTQERNEILKTIREKLFAK